VDVNERIDPQTGEVLEKINLPALVDTTLATAVVKAELDTQITTARAFPRSVQTAINDINQLSTMNEQMASECVYALPRAGKPLRGASIRLAEIVAQCWGNCVSKTRIVSVDRISRTVTAEGIFHDLQTNSITEAQHTRRISTKEGRLFTDDMIAVTCNAAQSIARRNAILAGVPKVIWWPAFQQCEHVIAGDVTTLVSKRESAIKAFAVFGLKPEQVFQVLDVKGEQDIGIDELVTLRSLYSSVKNGELTVEEILAAKVPAQPATPATRKTLEDFVNGNGKEKAQPQEQDQASPAAQARPPAAEPGASAPPEKTPDKAAAEAKIAAVQAEKTAAKTKAAPTGITTEADYIAQANIWIEDTESADALEQRWSSEKSLRNRSNVTAEARDQLADKVATKVAKLRGAT
jgi:hypothetical protein